MSLVRAVPLVAIAAIFVVACSGGGCHTSVSKSWDASYSMSFGGAADASVVVPPTDASVAVDASVATVFHRDVGPDERNLQLDPDGTFFWRIYGCDFSGGDCGVWTKVGTTWVLTPKPPATTMTWEDESTFTRKVTKVVLRDKGANLEARISADDGEKLLQAWFPGRICAPCGGGEGPSGKLFACNKPLVRSCP